MAIRKLTQQLIDSGLICPTDKLKVEYCDTELPGLYAEVRASNPGKGTFYLRYKDADGKTCHQKLARTRDMSLAEARRQGKSLKASIQLGADPRGEVKAARAVITFAEFFKSHYLPHAKLRKRSWERDEELFRLRIDGVFGGKRLNEITRHAVQKFQGSVVDSGLSPATADHHVKLVRRALNLAVEWQMLEVNPIKGVPLLNVDNRVEHYLKPDELDRLLTVLRTDHNRAVCSIALYLLSTGCRLNEALTAKWADIDSQSRTWRIPATNSKSKKVRSVPLNDSALEVLEHAETEGRHEHVFVNAQTNKPYTTIMKVWSRLRKEAGLPKLRIHDLRHQYASFLVNSGRSLYEVQQILGHSDPSVTQRYAHLSTKALLEAANSASIAIKGGTHHVG